MDQACIGRTDRTRTDGTSTQLRREDLAIRTVAVSLRSALREIRHNGSPDARFERISAVIAWARDSIRVHERAVSLLKRSGGGSPRSDITATLDAHLDDVRDALGAAERALDGERSAPLRR